MLHRPWTLQLRFRMDGVASRERGSGYGRGSDGETTLLIVLGARSDWMDATTEPGGTGVDGGGVTAAGLPGPSASAGRVGVGVTDPSVGMAASSPGDDATARHRRWRHRRRTALRGDDGREQRAAEASAGDPSLRHRAIVHAMTDRTTRPHGRIRQALPDEAGAITDLAIRSKAYWGYDASFMADAAASMVITAADIGVGGVWLLEIDDRPAGFYRLRQASDGHAVLEDLFLDPSVIGQGAGRRLWDHAVDEARRLDAIDIELESDPNAVGFYERMGAERIGERESPVRPGRMLPVMRIRLRQEP
jgi:GNAT superfamily N-acetyltransferase